MEEPRTMLFDLSSALKYSIKGEFEETLQVEVDPPCHHNYKSSAKLGQYFTRALMQSRSLLQGHDEEGQKESDMDMELDSGIVRIILNASQMDIVKIMSAFEELLLDSTYLDSQRSVKLKKTHLSKITVDDRNEMMYKYFATFIVPSVMSGLQSMGGS